MSPPNIKNGRADGDASKEEANGDVSSSSLEGDEAADSIRRKAAIQELTSESHSLDM